MVATEPGVPRLVRPHRVLAAAPVPLLKLLRLAFSPLLLRLLRDDDSEQPEPAPGAAVATTTIPRSLPRFVQPLESAAKTDGVSHYNSSGVQAALRFERRQAACSPQFDEPLFWHHTGTPFGTYDT